MCFNCLQVNKIYLYISLKTIKLIFFFVNYRNNCATNPYCLNGLGEKKLASLLQKEVTVSIERQDYLRKIDQHIGLKNLGATCYINTYLQVILH